MNKSEFNNVAEAVKNIIAEQLCVDADQVTETADLYSDLEADSLDKTQIVMIMEGEFTIEITDEAAGDLKTVQDCITYVENHMG